MDIKTYNALMGAAAIGLRGSIKERTSIEFDFSIQLKMQIGKLSKEDAIGQTAQERFIGMLTAFLTGIIGMVCCLFLVSKEESELVLLIPILLGYSPLIYASFFSNWWHKTKVINK